MNQLVKLACVQSVAASSKGVLFLICKIEAMIAVLQAYCLYPTKLFLKWLTCSRHYVSSN